MSEEDEITPLLKEAVAQLAGALVSTRSVLRMVTQQPTLYFTQSQREELSKIYVEGSDRLDKAMEAIEKLLGGAE
jgi:hypothetical protein